MLVESFAILAVYLLLLVSFLRSKHVGYAVAALPVAVIPVGYLLARGVLYFTGATFFGARPAIVQLFLSVLALCAACALVAAISRKIESVSNRRLYLIVMLVFCVLLGWVYIYNSLQYIL